MSTNNVNDRRPDGTKAPRKVASVVISGLLVWSLIPTRATVAMAEEIEAAAEAIQQQKAETEAAAEAQAQQDAAAQEQETASQSAVEESAQQQETATAAAETTTTVATTAEPEASAAASTEATAEASTQVDVALSLSNATLGYRGQTIAANATKVTVPTGSDFKFTATAANGYDLEQVSAVVAGQQKVLSADAQGTYTIAAADLAAGVTLKVETAQSSTAEQSAPATALTANTVLTDDAATQAASDSVDMGSYDLLIGASQVVSFGGYTGCIHNWSSSDASVAFASGSWGEGNVTKVNFNTGSAGTATITDVVTKKNESTQWREVPVATLTFTVSVAAPYATISGPTEVKLGDNATFTADTNSEIVEWQVEGDSDAKYCLGSSYQWGGTTFTTNSPTTGWSFNGDSKTVKIKVKYANNLWSDPLEVTITKRSFYVGEAPSFADDEEHYWVPTLYDSDTNEEVTTSVAGAYVIEYYKDGVYLGNQYDVKAKSDTATQQGDSAHSLYGPGNYTVKVISNNGWAYRAGVQTIDVPKKNDDDSSKQVAYFYLLNPNAADSNSYMNWLYAGEGTVSAPDDAKKGDSFTVGTNGTSVSEPEYFKDKTITVNGKKYSYDAERTGADGTFSIAWDTIRRSERSSNSNKWDGQSGQVEWLTVGGSLDWHVDGHIILHDADSTVTAPELSVDGPSEVEQFNTIDLTSKLTPATEGGTYNWSSNNENILTVDQNGKVTGVSQGTATVTVTWTSPDGKTTLTATHDVTVTQVSHATHTNIRFYYLNDPDGDLDGIKNFGDWEKIGTGSVNLTGLTLPNSNDNGANPIYDLEGRIVSWPSSSYPNIQRGSDDWNKIFANYKKLIEKRLGVNVTSDDVRSITLVPYKLTNNNDGIHVDCRVVIECNDVYTVTYYVQDPTASAPGYQVVASKAGIREGQTTNISDFGKDFPKTKTVDGVEYTFSGWFLDSTLTQSAVLPYTVGSSNVTFYAKYTAGRQVLYNLNGGTWDNGAASSYKVDEGKSHTVLGEPTREGYEFVGWTVEGLGNQTSISSGDSFTMPGNNVTITANWEKKSASVTVKYWWGSEGDASAKPLDSQPLEGDFKVDDVVQASTYAKDIEDYTVKPNQKTAVKLAAGENVINVYYYKNVTVSAVSAAKAYGDSDPEFTAKVSGLVGTDSISYTVSRPGNDENVGTYTGVIVASGDEVRDNYKVTYVPADFTITKKNASAYAASVSIDGWTYDGSFAGKGTLKAESDSDVKPTFEYFKQDNNGKWTSLGTAEPVDAGVYKVVATWAENQNYPELTAEKTFTVEKADLSVSATKEVDFNGQVQTLDLSSDSDGKTIDGLAAGDSLSFTSATVSGVNAGTYDLDNNCPVKVTRGSVDATGNYNITVDAKLIIKRLDSFTVSAPSKSDVYSGSPLYSLPTSNALGVTSGTVSGGTTCEYSTDGGKTYTKTIPQITDAGTLHVKVRATNPNYVNTAECEYDLTVTRRTLTVSDSATKTYNGEEQTLRFYFTASTEGLVSGESLDAIDAVIKGTDAGTYTEPDGNPTFKVKKADGSDSTGNYELKLAGTLNIKPVSGLAIDVASYSGTYDGRYHGGTVTPSVSAGTTVEYSVNGGAWTTEVPRILDAGTQHVKVRATNPNYSNEATAEYDLVVSPVQLTAYNVKTVTYTGKDQTLDLGSEGMTVSGALVDGEKLSLSGLTITGRDAGEYTNVAGTQSFSVTKKDGSSSTGNYELTASGKLIIEKNADHVVIKITGNKATAPYDGTQKSVSGYTYTIEGSDVYPQTGFQLKSGVVAKAAGTNADTYQMGLSADSFENLVSNNFSDVTFDVTDGSLEITPAALTAEALQPVAYNGQDQKLKPKVRDAAGNVLTEGVDYELSYEGDVKNAGTTGVTVTVTGNGNYAGSANVVYHINKRDVWLSSMGDSKAYDGTPLTRVGVQGAEQDDAGANGFVTGEATAEAVGSITNAGTATNTIQVNWADGADPNNYEVHKDEGTLEVTPLSAETNITVSGVNASYIYDGNAHAAATATASAVDGAGNALSANIKLDYRLQGESDDAWRSADQITLTNVADGPVTVEVRASADNFEGYAYGSETLAITPAPLAVTTASASKTYDGEALTKTDGWTLTGLKNGETATVEATGSRTEVGSSDNTYTIAWGTAAEPNYEVTSSSLGTLTVNKQSIVPDPSNPDSYNGITISSPSDSAYTGTEHKWVPEVRDADGNALTEGTDYEVEYSTDDFTDAGTITVTIKGIGSYTGEATRTYKITPAPLTVTTPSASKTYDGEPLTAEPTESDIKGLVNGETATVKASGSQTMPGSSKNTYDGIEWGTAKESNYTIISQNEGYLTVSAKNISTSADLQVSTLEDVTYNGLEQKQAPTVTDGEKTLVEGKDYDLSFSKDLTNVGTVTVMVTGKGGYAGTVTRAYNIKKAVLTVTTDSVSKPYTGSALTADGRLGGLVNNETADFKVTGSQTTVGSSTNWYTIDWNGTANPSNYEITEKLGVLTVTESENEVVVTTVGGVIEYDGNEHGATVTVGNLPEGYTAEATSNTVATDANGDGVSVTADNLVIRNTEGQDVTADLNVTKVDGTLRIKPKELSVVTDGATKPYDGEALTAGGKLSGLVDGEAATLATTGSQTEVGSSTNGYKIAWDDNAKESNYTIASEDLGKLEVTPNATAIIAVPQGDSKVYDGTALEPAGVVAYSVPAGFSYEATATGSQTDAGSSLAGVGEFRILDAAGNDVTSQFSNINTDAKANLTVTKRPVTLTSQGGTYTYNGSEHKNETVVASSGKDEGFVDGEGFDYSDFAAITAVGSVANTFSYKAKDGTNVANYAVTVATQDLVVSAQSINLDDPSYTGASVNAPTDVTYNGSEQAWVPTVTDASGNVLAEGEDYRVSYSGDLTNVGNVVVTITGRGNYAGTVTRSYAITPAEVTLASNSHDYIYNGEAQGDAAVSVSSEDGVADLFQGQVEGLEATGTVLNAGDVAENSIAYRFKDGFSADNYTITKNPGTLTVSAQSIDPSDPSYRAVDVDAPTDVTYNGADQTWSPIVTSAGRTLAAGVDYEVSYSTADRTNVTGEIEVTITGKGNYAGSVTRRYQVLPKDVSVSTASAEKPYDGEPLTAAAGASITGLVNASDASIEGAGTITEVGSTDNVESIEWASDQMAKNYRVAEKHLGTLTVKQSEDEVVVTTKGGTYTYTGESHEGEVEVGALPKGYTLVSAKAEGAATDVTSGDGVQVKVAELRIQNAAGEDVTSQLNVTYNETGRIVVNPATLTVATDSADKVYDGQPLTAEGTTIDGLVSGETATATATGSQTEVGTSKNGYSISWGTAKSSNYTISEDLGDLTVSAQSINPDDPSYPQDGTGIEVGRLDDVPYNGSEQFQKPTVTDAEGNALVEGADYEVAFSDDAKNVGAVTVTITGRGNYAGTVTRSYRITPAQLTVTTPSANKVYDGQPLTAEGATIDGLVPGETATATTTGSQTEVGSSDNTYTIAWGTVSSSNYEVKSESLGTLAVRAQSIDPADPDYPSDGKGVTVSAPADTVYDGQAHKWAPGVRDADGNTLTEGVDYTLDYSTDDFTDAGTIKVTIKGMGRYTGTVDRSYSIAPAPLTITTDSDEKVYDGEALTAGGSVDGLVPGEEVSFEATGSQTSVGFSTNGYSLAFDKSAKAGNYRIAAEQLGTLTVKQNAEQIVVNVQGGTFTYDGTAHGATVTVGALPEGYVLDAASSSASATDVNGDGAEADADTLVIRNAEGEDVTSELNVVVNKGIIKVIPASLTVTTPSASKVYDGEALAAEDGWTLTGLVSDETAEVKPNGSITEPGSADNIYTIDWGTAKESNYTIGSEALGTLTVRAQSVDPTDPDYRGTSIDVDNAADVTYDATEHKWTPSVSDKDGNVLTEGVDYEVEYSTDDFTDAGTITVTISGRGNYTGSVTRSYRIIPAALEVETGSASKAYDGTELTNSELRITGLKGSDSVTAAATGSQTEAGTSKNTYRISWTGALEGNYAITEKLGDLTVVAAPVNPSNPTTPTNPESPSNADNPTSANGSTTDNNATAPASPAAAADSSANATATPLTVVVNALRDGYVALTGDTAVAEQAAPNDEAAPEEQIYDESNPLGRAVQTCWVHFWMLLGMVATALYGAIVWIRRSNHTRKLRKNMSEILGDDKDPETQAETAGDSRTTNDHAGMEA